MQLQYDSSEVMQKYVDAVNDKQLIFDFFSRPKQKTAAALELPSMTDKWLTLATMKGHCTASEGSFTTFISHNRRKLMKELNDKKAIC